MTSVSHVTAMYATKRRRRNSKNVRTVCSKDSHSKSNPSKRHRERLNQELDTLASLLPFEQSVLSKLDKLSILRLSVSYLRTKSYFQAALSSNRLLAGQQLPSRMPQQQQQHYQHQFGAGAGQQQQQLEPATQSQQQHPAELRMEGDLIVQALNGFLLILTCDGEVFYTSHTVETYLGFHQSDICHQSVYELVHSEDREELMQQLKWNSMIPPGTLANGTGAGTGAATNPLLEATGAVALPDQPKSAAQMSLQEILASADHRHLLERNFTVRFRCLLDNTSGFLRLDIRGRIKVLHGQQNQNNLGNSASTNKKQQQQQQAQQQQQQHSGQGQQFEGAFSQREPMLAFFGVCIPFGPPSLLEMPSKDSVFKSKHRLDLSIISMDSRGKQLLGLNDLNSIFKQSANNSSTPPTGSTCTSPTAQGAASSGGSSLKSAAAATTAQANGCGSKSSGNQAASNATKQQQMVSAYDLVHHDDLSYMASAHQELLKTGASGLIAYRMITQTEGKHQWLQTSAKLYYKNSKPDFILCTHRPLMEEEGRDLLGKRTMDFKVTYLDVGLSSINDRIMACDKFSSLEALGNSSSASRGAKSPINGATGSTTNGGGGGGGGGHHNHHLASSPALSGESSSRSLASSSPRSMLNDDQHYQARGAKATGVKRKFNYDLNQQQQYLDDYDNQELAATQQNNFNSLAYDTRYKRGQNGDIFYDMDATVVAEDQTARRVTQPPTTTAGGGKKKAATSNKATNKQAAKKQRDLHSIDGAQSQTGEQIACEPLEHSKTSAKRSNTTNAAKEQTFGGIEAPSNHHHNHQPVSVDQQLHLYHSHYHSQHNQHHHLQTATEAADPYPAIQAAAVYAAASLGHSHPTGVSHQTAYAASAAANHAGYSHHNNAASQSLYGSASSMVSPSSAYSQHHQHHSHLHHLDSNTYQSTSAYGAFAAGHHHHHHQTGAQTNYAAGSGAAAVAAAAASSFLPTEHLLHHYSHSAAARSAASLVGWPAASSSSITGPNSTAIDYDHHHQHQSTNANNGLHSHQNTTYNAAASASWGAAAAAALVASANNGAELSNSKRAGESDSYSPSGTAHQQEGIYGQQRNDQQYQHQHLNQQHARRQSQHQTTSSPSVGESTSPSNKSASQLSAVAAAVAGYTSGLGAHHHHHHKAGGHGPASLNSDGSAHRSPLSSGESSNGSGSLAAAHAAAAAAAAATTRAASSESSAMISPGAYYLGGDSHSQQHQLNQHQQQQQQHQQPSYAHHSQQLAAYHHHHSNPYAAAHQGAYGDSVAHFNQHHYHHQHHQPTIGTDQHAAYFQRSGGDLSSASPTSGHGSASSAIAAVKLYGANGEMIPLIEQCTDSQTYYISNGNNDTTKTHSSRGPDDNSAVADNNWPSSNSVQACEYSGQQQQLQLEHNKSNDHSEFGHKVEENEGQKQEESQSESDATTSWSDKRDTGKPLNFLASSSEESTPGQADQKGEAEDDDDDTEQKDNEGETNLTNGATGTEESNKNRDQDQRDPLAQLISSTLGDIMLDIAPKRELA